MLSLMDHCTLDEAFTVCMSKLLRTDYLIMDNSINRMKYNCNILLALFISFTVLFIKYIYIKICPILPKDFDILSKL